MATPVRKPHTSTADLLVWSETPAADQSESRGIRTHQRPEGAIGKVLFGGQMTEEEAESLMKRKQCSGSKWREMTGSGIFTGDGEDDAAEIAASNSQNRTTVRMYQQTVNAMSQISFSAEECISPKKATSIAEVAKQRELSGTLETDAESKLKKQPSDAKYKELSGHDIFGPPPEIIPRQSAIRSLEKESKDIGEPVLRNLHTSVKVSNPAGGQSNFVFGEESPVKTAKKIHDQKFAELSGNDIFKGEAPPGSVEKPLSQAKLKEMSGSDIFADGKAAPREYLGGVRKPPGGKSSIALV